MAFFFPFAFRPLLGRGADATEAKRLRNDERKADGGWWSLVVGRTVPGVVAEGPEQQTHTQRLAAVAALTLSSFPLSLARRVLESSLPFPSYVRWKEAKKPHAEGKRESEREREENLVRDAKAKEEKKEN